MLFTVCVCVVAIEVARLRTWWRRNCKSDSALELLFPVVSMDSLGKLISQSVYPVRSPLFCERITWNRNLAQTCWGVVFKACTVFCRSNTEIVSLIYAQGTKSSSRFCLLVLSFADKGLSTHRSRNQGIPPNRYKQDSEKRQWSAFVCSFS